MPFIDDEILASSTSVKQFTRALVNTHCLIQEDLANYPVMRQRIRAILRNFDATGRNRDDAATKVARGVMVVLIGLHPRLLKERNGFDVRAEEFDMVILGLVDNFLVRKGLLPEWNEEEDIET